jgi:radical SAM superfamily enzyme YgiQ (UPF0313 family)
LILAGFVESISEVIVFDPEPEDSMLQEIIDFKPDIVGIGSMTLNYERARQIMSILKAQCGDTCLYVFGGVHPSIRPTEVYGETGADAVVVGEGEYALADIIRGKKLSEIPGVYVGQRDFVRSALIENLDELPLPAYHRMPAFHKYLLPPGTFRGTWQAHGTIVLMSARGCPAACIFCSSHLMFGRRIRRRSVDNVIFEIKYLLEHYGNTSFWFADDTFTYQKQWVYEFCEKITPLHVVWGCQARSDTITDELVVTLKDSGCFQIDLGIESGSDRVLKILNKGETAAQHRNALQTLRRHRVRSLATFIIGTPGETIEDAELTKNLIKTTAPSIVNIFFITPFPDTALFTMVEERGLWIQKHTTRVGIHDSPSIADTLTGTDQIRLRYELYAANRWRNVLGYLSLDFAMGFVKTITPGRVWIFFRELWRKNFHDAMYVYLQNYRASRDNS